ncbi:MAG TPA: methyltransferase domain-containing protein [Terriglobales bacterium]|nr:methyltransferase domain-containing protein [Terriglobales bacterium]
MTVLNSQATSGMERRQDKSKEIGFFNRHATEAEYNVFSERSNHRLISKCLELAKLRPPGRVADLGCGSGVFSAILSENGFDCLGLDISYGLVALGQRLRPNIRFLTADIEALPLPSCSLDGVMLSGVVHHLPDPRACAREVFRVLKPGGVFMAFDPNRMNPFMYLYRDRSSPFYSSKGVTENERPVLAWQVRRVFSEAGFEVRSSYLSGLSYRYVASSLGRVFLPAYNFLDSVFFLLPFLKNFSSFVLTTGVKKT